MMPSDTIGRMGCTSTHFGEEYMVTFVDGTTVDVFVWIRHGKKEKQNHARAGKMAHRKFKKKVVKVAYA